jgi:hypothetical protein
MQLQKINIVGSQALQASVNCQFEKARIPIVVVKTIGVAAFGEQMKLLASVSNASADALFAVAVTFRGVDDVYPRVQYSIQQCFIDRLIGA